MSRGSPLRRAASGLPSALTRLRRDRLSLVALALVSVLAAGTARTTTAAQVTLTGAVDASWRGAYDILVRPLGSKLDLEATNGLIEPDFLGYGNPTSAISLDQLAQIRALPGVEVAAPVSVLGYVLSSAIQPETAIGKQPAKPTLYRLTLTATTSDGLRTMPYVSETGTILVGGDASLYDGAVNGMSVSDPVTGQGASVQWLPLPALRTEVIGVDPLAEQALLGPRGAFLDPLRRLPDNQRGTLTSASFDCSLDAAALALLGTTGCASDNGGQAPVVPLVVANRLPAELTLHLDIEQLGQPLASGPTDEQVRTTAAKTLMDRLRERAGSSVTALGSTQRTVTTLVQPFGPQDLRTAFPGVDLATSGVPVSNGSPVDVSALAPTRPAYSSLRSLPGSANPTYALSSLGTINADGDPIGPSQWISLYRLAADEYSIGTEPSYRPLISQPLKVAQFYTPPGQGPVGDPPYYADAIGTFDPAALAGADAAQDPLAYVPLGAYAPPTTTVVAGPDGQPLANPQAIGPTLNPAGFIAGPPSAITDLLGATILRGARPIDAIRIRVAGLGGFDDLSRARVERVATALRSLGLDAEIVAGSSPQPVDLYVAGYNVASNPAADLGYVQQDWTSLGAAQRVGVGLGTTNLTLLALALLVAAAFAAGLASIRVVGRSPEGAILRAVGWSDGQILRYLSADGLLGGLVAEIVGVVAWVLGGPSASPIGLLAALLLAAVLPLSALVAAVMVLRRTVPAARLGGETWQRVPVHGWLAVQGPMSLGLRSVLARPARTLVTVAAAGIAAGATALGLLALTSRSVGSTLLAVSVATTLGPFQGLLLAFVAVTGVVLTLALERLALRDREPEFRVLAAAGWQPRRIRLSILTRRLILGLSAAPLAAVIGFGGALSVALAQPLVGAALAAVLALTTVLWSTLAGGALRTRRGRALPAGPWR